MRAAGIATGAPNTAAAAATAATTFTDGQTDRQRQGAQLSSEFLRPLPAYALSGSGESSVEEGRGDRGEGRRGRRRGG